MSYRNYYTSPQKNTKIPAGTSPNTHKYSPGSNNVVDRNSPDYKTVLEDYALNVIRAQDDKNEVYFSNFKPTQNSFRGPPPKDDFNPGNNHSRPEKVMEQRIAEDAFIRYIISKP